ncbi:hypothetical protein N9Z27_00015 [Alphaproteobacteria bacterium]|nr:hypothetical protein [Alphaproteobacteria bacterium]
MTNNDEITVRAADAKLVGNTLYKRKREIIKNFRQTAEEGAKAVLETLKEYIAIASSDMSIHNSLGEEIDFNKSNHIFYGVLSGHGYEDANLLSYDARKEKDLTADQLQTYMIGLVMQHFLFNGKVPEQEDVHENIDLALAGKPLSINVTKDTPQSETTVQTAAPVKKEPKDSKDSKDSKTKEEIKETPREGEVKIDANPDSEPSEDMKLEDVAKQDRIEQLEKKLAAAEDAKPKK